ncbi:hypothetical protein AB6T38_13330 [Aliiglaciecola sp. SL4]|uniref:hypothetical protein n=1 Tax=Aliiglaciecola sp. SL4 TaxID=3239806 RepID=UPI00355BEFCE
MFDLLAEQKARVANEAVLYNVTREVKQQTLDNATQQSKQWLSSPKGIFTSFVAGSCYELQSSSDSSSSKTIVSILLRLI